jgi:hypothetical protein
MLGRG